MSETNKNDSADSKETTPEKISLSEIDNEVVDILTQNALDQVSQPDSLSVKSTSMDKNLNAKSESPENLDRKDQTNENQKINIVNEALIESIPEPFKLADKKPQAPMKNGTNAVTVENLTNIELVGPSNPSNLRQIKGLY
jgi:hypothetical protein